MEKKRYIVLDAVENIHEFNIVVEEKDDGTHYELHTSNSPVWTEHHKDKLVLSLIDDGNDVTFKNYVNNPFIKKKKVKGENRIDYGLFNEMRILMNFRCCHDSFADSKYKVVEDITVLSI